MRILVGTIEIAGQIPDYADGFRKMGHQVTTVVKLKNKFFPDLTYDVDISQGINLELLTKLVDGHDLFFFQWGGSLLPGNQDFRLIKERGKHIISLFNGDDVRHSSAYRQQFGVPLESLGEVYAKGPLMRPLHNLRMAEWFSELIISSPDQSSLAIRPYIHFFYPLDLSRYSYQIPARDVPLVVHAPSVKSVKGTEQIFAALDRLKAKGIQFELQLFHDIPNEQVISALSNADIAIDQLYLPFGKFAAEAMACGCAVASGFIDDDPLKSIQPYVGINPDNVEERLEMLLTDKNLRLRLAEEGRRYVEAYHDHLGIAQTILGSYESINNDAFIYDHYPTFFARDYRIPENQIIPSYLKRMTSAIVQKHGLPWGTDPNSMIRRGLMKIDGLNPGIPIPCWREKLPTFTAKEGVRQNPLRSSFQHHWHEDECLTHYVKLTATCPNQAGILPNEENPQINALISIGDACVFEGNFQGAINSFKRAFDGNPQSLKALIGLANLALGQGLFADAIRLYSQLIGLKPDLGIAYFFLAMAQTFQNQANEALVNLKKAIELLPKRGRELIWGTTPIINNTYWSNAMREAGWPSKTLMQTFYGRINKRENYDLYYEDMLPSWVNFKFNHAFSSYFAFLYILLNAKVMHLPFSGGALSATPFRTAEAELLRLADIKVVVMPYGSDAYMYSRVKDSSLRHALLLSYPELGRTESEIERRVRYWTENADIVINFFMGIDGFGRWDVLVYSGLSIDIGQWTPKEEYAKSNGENGVVRVMHAPNHRGFKGTEFLIHAIEELRNEGWMVELVLLEGVQNDKVREMMREVDILVEQLVLGYGLNAVEGMASGLPVLSNLDIEDYTRLYRRYAALNECPILSTTPETIKENLKILIANPELRRELGQAGRQYVEKYHSYKTAQYMFGAIYDKILHGKDVDLMNLFHPLKSEYNKKYPKVEHPLIENHLPPNFFEENKT